MKVLIVGSGGREHAIAWKVSQSSRVENIICAPGNAGIKAHAECIDINTKDLDGLLCLAQKNCIDCVIVGPEAPLVEGIQNRFSAEGIPVFGPSWQAARLEGSKIFAKEFMNKYRIPTAEANICDDRNSALKAAKKKAGRCVIKADGLAAGKGVFVCKKFDDAICAIDTIMGERKFGSAGDRVIVEDILEGEEASIMVFSDGKNFKILASSQDHKAIHDGDTGPNTGGMGAYSPAPVVNPTILSKVRDRIIHPVIAGMAEIGAPFKGILYAGIMIVNDNPHVLEFNVRMGDPETQPILMRFKSDLMEYVEASIHGTLNQTKEIDWYPGSSICVVMASKGYPGKYNKGYEIKGLDSFVNNPDINIFHAGTMIRNGKIVTNGGRVLGVAAIAEDINRAKEIVYHAVNEITFENAYYRSDIAWRAISFGERDE